MEIGEPDDAMLAQVMVKLFADRQIAVDERIVSYLVTRMERSLDAARRVVGRLDDWRSRAAAGSPGRLRPRCWREFEQTATIRSELS